MSHPLGIAERLESLEERGLRRFFAPVPEAPDERRGLLFLASASGALLLCFLLLLETAEPFFRFVLIPALAVAILAAGVYQAATLLLGRVSYQRRLRTLFPRPTGAQVADLIEQRIQRLVRHSKLKLGLETTQGIEPLTLFSGVYWYTPGITREDLVHKTTERSTVCGVYSFVAIWLAPYRLAAFACDYNFLRDSILNERRAEFFYEDIVSISVAEEGSSLTTPSGITLRTAQRLRIAVANNEFFVVTVDSPELRGRLEIEEAPQDQVEKMLAAVRQKLKERRTAKDRQDGGRFAGLP